MLSAMRARRLRTLVPAVAAPAFFGLAAAIGARRVPGYRHRDEPMSALAASNCAGAPVMVPGFLATSAATLLLGRALRSTRVPKSVPIMMQAAGVGMAAAGIARQSDRSCPVRFAGDENVTISDDLHVLSAMVVFGSWIAMPLVTAVRGSGLRPIDRKRALALGLVALAGQVWTSVLVQHDSEKWGGVAQRLTVGAALGFYPVVAIAATA
jgi:hypothetical protein